MDGITFNTLMTTVTVLLSIFGAIAIVDKGIISLKNLTGKKAREHEMASIGQRLDVAEQRLDKNDQRLDRANEDMSYLLKAMNAMLMHQITGNGIDTLKKVKDDLDSYLSTR